MRLFNRTDKAAVLIEKIHVLSSAMALESDAGLRIAFDRASSVEEVVAAAAVAASRVLGENMFDVQLRGALALTSGKVAEMQTGEGKTLTAVAAAAWYARARCGVHVLTVNDYLARRDAGWMSKVYGLLGLTVAAVQQGMTGFERKSAYAADIAYVTGTEAGFDYLRDQMALRAEDQVLRPFAVAIIDEADSILIDEARIPLVIAGGGGDEDAFLFIADSIARQLRLGVDFLIGDSRRNVTFTDAGIARAERISECANLFEPSNLTLFAALQNSLHAHALLRRDVDYIVKDGAVKSVDEWKGRVIEDRRWPAGLHAALEVKERVKIRAEGVILGSITLQNLIALYPQVCGMTGTALSQAAEFLKIYGLEVEAIPTNRPMIRIDQPDRLFSTKAEKLQAVVEEIRRVHATGRPVLVGTGSVEESDTLSGRLGNLPHDVLNARDDEREAAIVARAGERSAITVSTNMAGRGTDILLGEGVAALGGLYVIGLNRHESRRIDSQLRGRAGRQGDAGESRFFVSMEDDLVVKYGGSNPEEMQKFAEGQNLEIRELLHKYESTIEGQRLKIQALRQAILTGEKVCETELARLVSLRAIDVLWSQHLANIAELRGGVQWVSWGGRDPLHQFLLRAHEWFEELELSLSDEIARRLAEAEASGTNPQERGAVWTYLTTDQPFGTWTQRVLRGMLRKYRSIR